MPLELINHDSDDPLFGTAYRTIGELGEGGVGRVLEAVHVVLGTRVAVKVLQAAFCRDEQIIDRLRLEAVAQARVAHPAIVACSDFGVTRYGEAYLVTERLVGRSLSDELAARKILPVEEAIGYATELLSALSAAHRAGIIHRDIKPANVFLHEAGGARKVKLLDFGIAKVLEGAPSGIGGGRFPTREGLCVGTPRWCPPEQARGKPVDARTDLYAVAATLYALVSGRGPFDHHPTAPAMMIAHTRETPAPPSRWAPHLPRALDLAILQGLEKDPMDRFASAEDMSAALLRCLAEEAIAPNRPAPGGPRGPATEPLERPSRPRWPATEPMERPSRPRLPATVAMERPSRPRLPATELMPRPSRSTPARPTPPRPSTDKLTRAELRALARAEAAAPEPAPPDETNASGTRWQPEIGEATEPLVAAVTPPPTPSVPHAPELDQLGSEQPGSTEPGSEEPATPPSAPARALAGASALVLAVVVVLAGVALATRLGACAPALLDDIHARLA